MAFNGLVAAKPGGGERAFDPAPARTRLDNAPKGFDPAWLSPGMCRLRAYAPDAIPIEAMSGGRLDAQAQGLSLRQSPSMGAGGRQRVAAWDAQNLRMATTIREMTATIPGGKALLVVGAAHKPFLEAYLRAITGIEIVSVSAMLDARPPGCRAGRIRGGSGRSAAP